MSLFSKFPRRENSSSRKAPNASRASEPPKPSNNMPTPPGMDRVSQFQHAQRRQGLLAQKDRPVKKDDRPTWERHGFKSENHMNQHYAGQASEQAKYAAREEAKSPAALQRRLREADPSPQNSGYTNTAIRGAKGYK